MEGRVRELALFNLGIDSPLRGWDLVALKVRDICHGDHTLSATLLCASGAAIAGAQDDAKGFV